MMINQLDDGRFMLVLQIDHSRIAGLLAAHWGNESFARLSPYASMVLAAQEHDNGWWDWEIKPTIGADGLPTDYIGSVKKLERGTWLSFYRAGIERLIKGDPYAGLIVLMHADGLLTQGKGLLPYMPDYRSDPDVREFLEEREQRRVGLLAELKNSPEYAPYTSDEQIWTNFKYMEIFDQFGQFVCNRYPFNSTTRTNGPSQTLSDTPIPTRPGQPDTKLTVTPVDASSAVVSPYPFDIDPLPLEYPARIIPKRQYATREEFLAAYYPAERVTISYTLRAG